MSRWAITRVLLVSALFLFLAFTSALFLLRGPNSPLLGELLQDSTYWVIDEKGKVLSSSSGEPLPTDYNEVALPSPDRPTTFHPLASVSSFVVVRAISDFPRLFLVIKRDEKFLADILSIQGFYFIPFLLIYGLGFGLVLRIWLRRKRRNVERVLSAVAGGNLKARFAIRKRDRGGVLMEKFNQITEWVERLVEKRKATERSTSELLSDLSRDIQPRVNQLRKQIRESREMKDPFDIQERLEASVFGMQLFERLIESLFLIAQIRSPGYRTDTKSVSLIDVFSQEIDKLKKDPRYGGKQFLIRHKNGSSMMVLKGEPFVIQQLAQKALENAGQWAKWRVEVSFLRRNGNYEVVILDDGPGFSAEAMENFGSRRALQPNEDSVSLGMGSLILRSIVEAYGGSIRLRNHAAAGAELTLSLPEPIADDLHSLREVA